MQLRLKNIIALTFIFLLMWALNYYTPIFFGDDMIYQFKWEAGIPFFEQPNYNTAQLSSLYDVIQSVYSHYFDWHGRITGTFFMFLAGWMPKDWFNICNALMATGFIFLICKLSAINGNASWKIYLLAFALIWIIFQGWVEVFLWMSGSTSYLWTTVIILLFSYPYVHAFYYPANIFSSWITGIMLPLGLIAGATNEMAIPPVIIGCFMVIWHRHKEKIIIPRWMYAGIIGLILGYTLMILSPSISIRILAEVKDIEACIPYTKDIPIWVSELTTRIKDGHPMKWLFWAFIKNNFFLYLASFLSGFSMICVNYILLQERKSIMKKENYYFCGYLLFASLCSSLLMVFSLTLPGRAFFFSYTCIIITFLILLREYKNTEYKFYRLFFKCIYVITCTYFIISVGLFTWHKTMEWEKWKDFDAYMKTREGMTASYTYTPERYKGEIMVLGKQVWFFANYRLIQQEDKIGYASDWIQESVKKYYKLKGLKLYVNPTKTE